MTAVSLSDVLEAAVRQCSLLSFGAHSRVGGCTVFVPEASGRGILAGGCITGVSCHDEELTLTVVPAQLRLLPLRFSTPDSFFRLDADLPWLDAVALLDGLPPVRLQGVSPTFPVFRDGGLPDDDVSDSDRERRARQHLERLCALAPPHLADHVLLTWRPVTAWFLVSYLDSESTPDPCVFILPDALVVRAAVVQVGFRAISPHTREALVMPAFDVVRRRLQKLQLPNCVVRVIGEMDFSIAPPLLFTSAARMTL
ncbi:uncharacterized protein Tco025E_08308 [Trypanosoma conorhini]|uniref:Uncharacterized protein n=1 Tax=Trypanosoma conorhini TaxID=83891 RepID=A0A3R7KB92_9TRYP|nr:uncharacterized protein Tco025E_08308 [Trypanosoma conorhini]RNF03079.1 hypothetical protein Tco025E_08308 [Trypanosoma conorhini]